MTRVEFEGLPSQTQGLLFSALGQAMRDNPCQPTPGLLVPRKYPSKQALLDSLKPQEDWLDEVHGEFFRLFGREATRSV